MSKLPLPAELEQDNRSMKQWMEDQGLEYINKAPKLEKVKWILANKNGPRGAYEMGYDISLAKTCLTVTAAALEKLKCTRLIIGTGLLNGEAVMVLRPVEPNDTNGYCLTLRDGHKGRFIRAPHPLKRLVEAGLQPGKYKLYKAKGGFVAKHIKT